MSDYKSWEVTHIAIDVKSCDSVTVVLGARRRQQLWRVKRSTPPLALCDRALALTCCALGRKESTQGLTALKSRYLIPSCSHLCLIDFTQERKLWMHLRHSASLALKSKSLCASTWSKRWFTPSLLVCSISWSGFFRESSK